MMEDQNFRFDDGGLQRLLKVLEGDRSVRIGVFGGAHPAKRKEAGAQQKIGADRGRAGARKMGRTAADTTNAEVGFLMEYGAPGRKIPARSWLRMPIITRIQDIVKGASRGFGEAVAAGDQLKFLTLLGVQAEAWIERAFDTRGFGSWAPNKESTIARKGSDTPLIDTGQLRRSVTSMVV